MRPNGKAFWKAASVVLALGAVWLLNASSGSHGNDSGSTASDAACNICQEVMIGSFSCAVQGAELLAQVNFQGSGDLTPSATGAGMVVLGAVPGGSASLCESLASKVNSALAAADCAIGRIGSPTADQRVFDFACRGQRSSLVRAMGEVSQKVISLSP
jgi:hypothetical protein